MDIQVKVIRELEDGGAICILDMDEQAKEYLVGEGFLAVLKRALETSESYVKPENKIDDVDNEKC